MANEAACLVTLMFYNVTSDDVVVGEFNDLSYNNGSTIE